MYKYKHRRTVQQTKKLEFSFCFGNLCRGGRGGGDVIPTCYREHTPRDGPSWWRGGWAPPPGWFSSPGPVSAFSLTGLWILSCLLSPPLTHCHLGLLEHWSTKPTTLLVYWMMMRCWFLPIYSAWQKTNFLHIKIISMTLFYVPWFNWYP